MSIKNKSVKQIYALLNIRSIEYILIFKYFKCYQSKKVDK